MVYHSDSGPGLPSAMSQNVSLQDLPLVTSDQFSSREIAPFNNGQPPQSDETESSGTLLSLDMFLF